MTRFCSARTPAWRVHAVVNVMVSKTDPASPRVATRRAGVRAPQLLPQRLFKVLCIIALAFGAAYAEPADWIYSARYVVTMDARHRLIDDGAVAVRGERIVGVGTRAEIDRQFQAAHRVDRPNALIMPGLVNTHAHAAMSLLRGLADDLKLQDWLQKFIFPAEAKNVTPDFVLWGTRLACLTMVFKLMESASKHWRLLNGSKLMGDVIAGVIYVDGVKENAA